MKPSGSAPANRIDRRWHLLSPVDRLAFISLDLPWQTFALSWPLQSGIWLLRCLRPLFRPLAFSWPLRVKRRESSLIPIKEVIVPLSDLLYAGWSIEASPQHGYICWGNHLIVLVVA